MESPRLANYLLVLVTGILALVTYFLYGATRNLVAVERKPEQEHSKQAVLTALGHLEQAMDSHLGTRSCIRYIVRNQLIVQAINSQPLAEWPRDSADDDRLDRESCLGGLYALRGLPPVSAQWDYARQQIWPWLNARIGRACI